MRAVAYVFMQIAGAIVGSGTFFPFFSSFVFRENERERERERERELTFCSPPLPPKQSTAFVWTVQSVAPAANVLSKTGRVGHAGGFMVEFLLTFALMWVTLAATDASRYRSVSHLPILAPLAIGMTYFIAHMAAIPIDGCSINPARFLGTFTLSGVGGWAMVRECFFWKF